MTPLKIAKRMAMIDASGIRKVFDLAARMENPVDFSIGQPDFDVPLEVKEAAIEALRSGFNKYTVTQGIPELRQALLARISRDYHWEPEGILVTCGVSGGLVLALLVLVDSGDEVLMADPYFVMYKHLVHLAGGVPRFVSTYPDFRLTRERIESRLSPKSKVLILNSPSNPTGVLLTEKELEGIAALVEERNLFVITDEIYRSFCYDGPYPSFLSHRKENVLLLDGFSKSHALAGWRLGFAAGPEELISEMTKLQQYTFVCAPSMVQYAGIKALQVPMEKYVEAYRKRRDMIYEGLKDILEVQKPGGAFYVFPKVPDRYKSGDMEFCQKALEKNVLVIPGSVFSERSTHFRISYATSFENIERGIKVLRTLT